MEIRVLRRDELIKMPFREIPFRHHRNATRLINSAPIVVVVVVTQEGERERNGNK